MPVSERLRKVRGEHEEEYGRIVGSLTKLYKRRGMSGSEANRKARAKADEALRDKYLGKHVS